MLLNNQEITEEIKEEIKKYLESKCGKMLTVSGFGWRAKESNVSKELML